MFDYTEELHSAVVNEEIALVQFALEYEGADVDAIDQCGQPPLHCVHNYEIAKLLIEFGADVNARDIFGYAPLHCVHNYEIAKLLIDNGADVNARDGGGYDRTPLMLALIFKHYDIAELLIENGANVNDMDVDGKTMINFVDTNRIRPEFVKLLKYGNYSDYCKSVKKKGKRLYQESRAD